MRGEFKIRRLQSGGYVVSGLEPHSVDAYSDQEMWTDLAAFSSLDEAIKYIAENMVK